MNKAFTSTTVHGNFYGCELLGKKLSELLYLGLAIIDANKTFAVRNNQQLMWVHKVSTPVPQHCNFGPPPKVSARAPAHRSYHLRGVKLKSCIKKIHHNLYISKQANVRIKHADTEGSSHKKFGTDARVQ